MLKYYNFLEKLREREKEQARSNLGSAILEAQSWKRSLTKAIQYHKYRLQILSKMAESKNAEGAKDNYKDDIECLESDLKIPKEVGDRAGEGNAYCNLGNAHDGLGDFKKAIDYHELHLKIAKEVGDRAGEGSAYGNLGNAHHSLGDFKKAIDYHKLHLKIAKEVGDRAGEGRAYCNLGNAHRRLGDLKKGIDYHELHLKIAKEVGDRAGEGKAYGNLGNAHGSLGDFKKAIDYHKLHLKIAKEVGDRAIEGSVYGHLGNAHHSLGDFKKAIDYHKLHLKIAKEVGDRAGEGRAYCNLGNAHRRLGDFKKAIDYHELHLKIAKEVGDRAGEGIAYCNLGNAHDSLGDLKKAIDYHELDLKIAKEVGDKAGEGSAYGNLGNAHGSLGDFIKAIDYHELHLKIAKEVGDRAGEGSAYCNLGNALQRLGDFKKAIDYHELDLKIAKEVGDRAGEGVAYGNLGNAHDSLGDFKKAIDYHELHLKIAKEVGDRAGEGRVYGNLGNAHHSLGDFKKAIDYHKLHLKIAKEVGDRAGEGMAYGNLGNAHDRLGDFKKAIDYHELDLKIAKKVGDKAGEGSAYSNLGNLYDRLGDVKNAIDSFKRSIAILNHIRDKLQFNDDWKVSYRNMHDTAYTNLWRLLLKQGKIIEALFCAEQGRAQALKDLMEEKYGMKTTSAESGEGNVLTCDILSSLPSNIVFIGIDREEVVFWVRKEGENVELRRGQISDGSWKNNVETYLQLIMENACLQLGVRADVKCEDRSLEKVKDEKLANERSSTPRGSSAQLEKNALRTLYDFLFGPIADLVQGHEVIFVPEGLLCLVPYAALMDLNSKYLCEALRIRVLPSLTTLKLITDCEADYHSKTGALLVGDPWVQGRTYKGAKLQQLHGARKEVKMIGQILGIAALIGKQATKDQVLKRLSSVALVHIAAHGDMATGEIALAPNTAKSSSTPNSAQHSNFPVKEDDDDDDDVLLTMKDVLDVKMRARLVVLSCCHSARGEVKAEGVVGIARAFLGAGARSVLVSLCAIDDEATLEFMKIFYRHLVNETSASQALNRAMKCMRESVKFSAVKYWAPFVLIGDDVTLQFDETKQLPR